MTDTENTIKPKILTLTSFWILGLCNNFGYVVMLSSAHDILKSKSASSAVESNETISSVSTMDGFARECNHLSTGVILLADIIPALFIKTFIPFFALHVHRRLSTIICLTIASFVTVARADTEFVAAIGVALTSLASGLGESTFLSYMVNYDRNVITTWSSGTGAAGILGALTYAGLTGVFHLSPSTTMYLMLSVPGLMALTFWVLLEHPNKCQTHVIAESPSIDQKLNVSSKLSCIPSLMIFMIPLGLVYFFEYLINQGLFELIYFENTFLTHAEQYRWYQVVYQLGVFISRTSIHLFLVDKIWIFTVLQGLNVVLFLSEALYSFLPNIYIIFALVLFEGLLGGGAYANTYHNIMKKVTKEKQEFAMAMTSLSDSVGISLSGVLAIPLHNRICQLPK